MSGFVRAGVAMLAPPPGEAGAGPALTLLAGGTRSVGAALDRWLGERPGQERWALVRSGPVMATPGPAAPRLALEQISFAGGCACCVGASAFSLVLARLLRRGPWDRLLVELPVSADPGAVADSLSAGPLASWLRAIEIVTVVPARGGELASGSLAARAMGAADLVVLDTDPAASTATASGELPCADADFAASIARGRAGLARLGAEDAGADPLLCDSPLATLSWPALRAALAARRTSPRWLTDVDADDADRAERPEDAGGTLRWEWAWPAATVFDRALIEAALRRFAARSGGLALRARIRTRRDWYACHHEVGGPLRWMPTLGRGLSRIVCRVARREAPDPGVLEREWLACREASRHDGT